MNLIKSPYSFIILFLSFQLCFSQEKPKAEMIAMFGKVNCEIASAQLEALRIELGNDLNSTGYIIIFGEKSNSLENYKLEKLLEDIFPSMGIEPKRVVFAHGIKREDVVTELWIVPSGAEKPSYTEEKWDYSLPEIRKPFKLHEKVWENDICPRYENEEFYSRLLLANSDFRGNIVVHENSARKFRKTKNNLITELVNKYKVPLKGAFCAECFFS